VAVDLAFWQAHAAGYDEHASPPGYYEGTLAAIRACLHPNDTLLDVGAGTGRFALPLAGRVKQLTALDHAGPMLDILRRKLRQQNIANINVIEATWEAATVEPHDVVLAAWSLYRLPDILAGMHKLIAATRRTLIIVVGAGHSLRHDPLLRAVWPAADEPSTPLHIYFYGVLWQAGVHADLHIVNERRLLHGPTPATIARALAPQGATDPEIDQLTSLLAPSLAQEQGGWRYEQAMPVGILIWQANQR
jgi:SAM-dependent methyltransferase